MENCNKIHNISMGCCQPVLAPIEYYYTKWQTENYVTGYTYSKKEIDEKTSGETSGCCITPEEVDERIALAKTEIEQEIPSLSGYATEQWVEDKHYLTEHQSLSAYSTTEEMNTAINQSVSGKANASDVQTISSNTQTISGDLQTLSAEVQTIIISGVSGISSAECQSMIDESISGKLDTSIFQPFSASVETSLVNKQDASGMTAYTQNVNFTAHTADTNIHVTANEKQTWNNKSDFSGNYNDLTNKPSIPVIWNGTKAQFDAIIVKDPNTLYLVNE